MVLRRWWMQQLRARRWSWIKKCFQTLASHGIIVSEPAWSCQVGSDRISWRNQERCGNVLSRQFEICWVWNSMPRGPNVLTCFDLKNHLQVDQPEVFALPAAKRRRCNELRQDGGYQLEANAGSVAPNPRAFKVHPLREEQLRSLAWMYSREACRDGFKGGMLADKMGYGKTATTIGMLSEKPGQVPDERPSGYIRTGGAVCNIAYSKHVQTSFNCRLLQMTLWIDQGECLKGSFTIHFTIPFRISTPVRNPATLILCPPHLVEQWEDEFFKFLGDEVQLFRPTPPSKAKDRETLAAWQPVIQDIQDTIVIIIPEGNSMKWLCPESCQATCAHWRRDLFEAKNRGTSAHPFHWLPAVHNRCSRSFGAQRGSASPQCTAHARETFARGWQHREPAGSASARVFFRYRGCMVVFQMFLSCLAVSITWMQTLHMLGVLPPRQDSGGERRASSTRTATWNFQHFLDENCRPGCTVQVTVTREKKPRIEPFRGDGPFRILTIANSKDFARLRLKDLLPPEPFNVVLVSTGILGSERHMMHVSQVVCSWHGEKSQSMLCDGKPMSVRQKMLHECVDKWHQKDSFLRAALATSPTLLETMWWNRMPRSFANPLFEAYTERFQGPSHVLGWFGIRFGEQGWVRVGDVIISLLFRFSYVGAYRTPEWSKITLPIHLRRWRLECWGHGGLLTKTCAETEIPQDGAGWVSWVRVLDHPCARSDEISGGHVPLGSLWNSTVGYHRCRPGSGGVVVVCHRCYCTLHEWSVQAQEIPKARFQKMAGRWGEQAEDTRSFAWNSSEFVSCMFSWFQSGGRVDCFKATAWSACLRASCIFSPQEHWRAEGECQAMIRDVVRQNSSQLVEEPGCCVEFDCVTQTAIDWWFTRGVRWV